MPGFYERLRERIIRIDAKHIQIDKIVPSDALHEIKIIAAKNELLQRRREAQADWLAGNVYEKIYKEYEEITSKIKKNKDIQKHAEDLTKRYIEKYPHSYNDNKFIYSRWSQEDVETYAKARNDREVALRDNQGLEELLIQTNAPKQRYLIAKNRIEETYPVDNDLSDPCIACKVLAEEEQKKALKLKQGPLTEKEAEGLFNYLASQDDISFAYPRDGCYARAHIMTQRMKALGVTPKGKAWAFAPGYPNSSHPLHANTDNDPAGYVEWGYHVAPVIQVRNKKGEIEDRVIDPSLFKKPVTPEEWVDVQRPVGTYELPELIQTIPGQSPKPEYGGDGYWPGETPPDGADKDAAKTMARFKIEEQTSKDSKKKTPN